MPLSAVCRVLRVGAYRMDRRGVRLSVRRVRSALMALVSQKITAQPAAIMKCQRLVGAEPKTRRLAAAGGCAGSGPVVSSGVTVFTFAAFRVRASPRDRSALTGAW